MSWRLLHATVKGSGHEECQDYHRVETTKNSLIALACDGAGSAKCAFRGAKMAADTLLEKLQHFEGLPDEIQLRQAVQEVRSELLEEAVQSNEPLSAFSTTLLGTIVKGDKALFFQVGDGVIIHWKKGEGEVVFWPKSYEYVNQTAFLTDEICDLQIRSLSEVAEVALLTDGLQPLSLQYSTQTVFENFFIPFRRCLEVENSENLNAVVETFLDSPQVNQRTQDDKTLIVAKYESL